MFGLSKRTAAFANLAASVNALAAVVDAATGRLRQQLALEDVTAAPAGQVIDHGTLPAPEPPAEGQGCKGRARPAA
jgi:hypothetical protein